MSFFTRNKSYFKYIFTLFLFIMSITGTQAQTNNQQPLDKYKAESLKIIFYAMKNTEPYDRIAYMCDTYGPRLSGSKSLNEAIEWIYKELKKDGFDNVHKEDVMVPHWVRNNEHCELVEPRKANIPVLALGGSIATPPGGITAPVLVVHSYEELDQKASEAKGKIVVYNKPWLGYGDAVQFRVTGAIRASKCGAVASLIRSASPIGMRNPHTGVMVYNDSVPKIPHAAITAEDAAMLERMSSRGQNPIVHLYLEAKTLPDTLSYNVMGEIRGTEKPDEIISVGGHIDSWDVGTGAQDDASGIFTTWSAVKLLKEIGLIPKRTIRFVAWVNEENGSKGGEAYAKKHKDEKHSLLFEFDSGVFPPSSINYGGDDSILKYLQSFEPLFTQIDDSIKISKGGWGVDISALAKQNNVPVMSLGTGISDKESKYFWYHHSPADTVDKIDPKEFNKCIAAIALALYIYADMP
ncbi:MAG: M20/M25/M40 family metallo-hydrolase [FCB group bacterium]